MTTEMKRIRGVAPHRIEASAEMRARHQTRVHNAYPTFVQDAMAAKRRASARTTLREQLQQPSSGSTDAAEGGAGTDAAPSSGSTASSNEAK